MLSAGALPMATAQGLEGAFEFGIVAANCQREPASFPFQGGDCVPVEGAVIVVTASSGELIGTCIAGAADSDVVMAGCTVRVAFGSMIVVGEDLSTLPAGNAPTYDPQAFEVPAEPPNRAFGGPMFVNLPQRWAGRVEVASGLAWRQARPLAPPEFLGEGGVVPPDRFVQPRRPLQVRGRARWRSASSSITVGRPGASANGARGLALRNGHPNLLVRSLRFSLARPVGPRSIPSRRARASCVRSRWTVRSPRSSSATPVKVGERVARISRRLPTAAAQPGRPPSPGRARVLGSPPSVRPPP